MGKGRVQVVGPALTVAQRRREEPGQPLPAGGFVEFRPAWRPGRRAFADVAAATGRAAGARQAGAAAVDAGTAGQQQRGQKSGGKSRVQTGTRQTSMTLAKGLPSFIGSVSTVKPKRLISSTHSASGRQ